MIRMECLASFCVECVSRAGCDSHCDTSDTCNNHGPGTCDNTCVAGFGLSTSNFMCGGKVGSLGSRS